MKFEERTQVTLLSGDSKIFSVMHLPKNGQRAPCVLFFNGFSGFKSGKFRLAVRQSEALSKAGIASFRFDYRGTGDSEGNFSDITIKSQVEDALSSLQYLMQHESIDPENIGFCARSLGAIIALKLAEQMMPKTICLWAPVFDTIAWHEGRSAHRWVKHNENGATFAGQMMHIDLLHEFSTLSAKRALENLQDMPLCIFQAGQDTILDQSHFDKYVAERKNAIAETKIHILEKSDHDFNIPQEQETLIKETAAWFSKELV